MTTGWGRRPFGGTPPPRSPVALFRFARHLLTNRGAALAGVLTSCGGSSRRMCWSVVLVGHVSIHPHHHHVRYGSHIPV